MATKTDEPSAMTKYIEGYDQIQKAAKPLEDGGHAQLRATAAKAHRSKRATAPSIRRATAPTGHVKKKEGSRRATLLEELHADAQKVLGDASNSVTEAWEYWTGIKPIKEENERLQTILAESIAATGEAQKALAEEQALAKEKALAGKKATARIAQDNARGKAKILKNFKNLQAQASLLMKAISELTNELSCKKQELAEKQKAHQADVDLLREAQSALSKLKSELSNQTQEFQRKEAEHQAKVRVLESANSALREQLAVLQAKNAELIQAAISLGKDSLKANTEIDGLRNLLEEKEKKINILNGQLEDATNFSVFLTADKEKLEANSVKLTTEKKQLEATVKTLEANSVKLTAEKLEIEATVTTLKQKLTTEKERAEKAEDDLSLWKSINPFSKT